METIIRAYFKSWIDKNESLINEHFHDNIVYTECYGPRYLNKAQCLSWFRDWNLKGRVLKWDILNMDHTGNTYYVTWYFECDFEGEVEGFDGLSVIRFDEDSKIIAIDEYQSKHEHHYPYGGLD